MKTSDFSIGQSVMYKPTGESGIVTSIGDIFVFVRYGSSRNSQATRPSDLT